MPKYKPTNTFTAEQLAERNQEEKRRERLRRQEEYMQSPEYKAMIVEQERNRKLREEETRKRQEWHRQFTEACKLPRAGTILEDMKIWVSKEAVVGRIILTGAEYPNLPRWISPDTGFRGLICFLRRSEVAEARERAGDGILTVKKIRIMGYTKENKAATISVVEW